MFLCFKRKYKKKKKKKGDLYKYMYTAPIESNIKKKKKKERKALYLSVNLISTKVLIGDTIELTLPRVPFLFLRSFRSVFSVILAIAVSCNFLHFLEFTHSRTTWLPPGCLETTSMKSKSENLSQSEKEIK